MQKKNTTIPVAKPGQEAFLLSSACPFPSLFTFTAQYKDADASEF